MPKSIGLTINNSKKSAVKSGTWKDPGAKFYDTLMWAYDNRWVANGRNTLPEEKEYKNWHYWQDFLKEAYLKAPVSKIANKGPYGTTPFSKSECKYPHHVIRKGELVVSIPGLKAAYTRVCQMHELKGDIKEHLERHIKELGIQASFHDGMLSWNEAHEVKIEENFNSIYDYIQENTGIDLHDDYITEKSHGKLKYDFRFGWDYNTGHQVKIVYSLDNIEVTGVGDFYWKYNKDNRNADGSLKMDENQYKDWVSKNITRKGNNDHQSKGQKVLSIIDLVNNQKLNSVKLMSPIALDGYKYRFTRYTAIPENILPAARKIAEDKNGIQLIKVGEIDNTPTFKATSWFTKVIDKSTGDNLRFNKLAKAEFIKIGRGIKPDDIQAKNFEVHDDPELRPLIYDNPNKKEALTELFGIERNALYFIKLFKYAIQNNEYPQGWDYNRTKQILDQYMNKLKYIQHDIDTIKSGKYNLSMMKKYKEASMIESAEEDRSEYIANVTHVDYVPPTQEMPYYTIPFSYDSITESTEVILEDAINDILDQGGVTPQEVFEWIRSNISYDKASPSEWKLKSPQETYDLKKGNCHDQSLLAFTLFKSMGLKRGQIFFIEYKEGETVGGNTHTFTWYIDENDKKYYWFETAWEDKAGIHGPFDSIADLKDGVRKAWYNDNDLNSRSYSGTYWDDIEFSETPRYKVGMGLGDYVDSWVFVEDIKEAMDWIDNFVNDEYFRENADNPYNDKLITTPADLLKWMDCINYGWINSKGEINKNGGDDFYKRYRLQSPQKVLKNKVGVCWDQTEFERSWFDTNNYSFAIIYVEISDDKQCPSHTFLIYQDNDKYYWFEHSWNSYKGIHEYDSISKCIHDVIIKHQTQWNDFNSPLIVTNLTKKPKYGIGCQEFMDYAHNSDEVDLYDISNEIFSESVNLSEDEMAKVQSIFDSLTKEEKAVYGYGPGIDNNTCYVKIMEDAYIMLDDYTNKKDNAHLYPGLYVGIAAAKSSRGKGITDKLIRCAKQDNPNVDLVSIVENNNHASIHLFTRNGFEFAGEEDGFSWYICKSGSLYDPPLEYDKLPDHLKDDPIHSWRAKTGIELIHKEPTLNELNRIWKNWQLMTNAQKKISDDKSIELFGKTNEDNYKELCKLYNQDTYTIENLPDKLYFASSVKMDRLTGRVFLTPHIGIASLFIVNLKPVMRDYFDKYTDHELTRFNYNSGYEEWNWDNDKLQKPLDMIHINHNVPEYTQVETGTSSGFIHVVDISSVKDKLKTFITNNPDREVIYEGEELLPILEVIPHTVNWEIKYDESNTIEHGKGFVESYESNILMEEVDALDNQETKDEPPTIAADSGEENEEKEIEQTPEKEEGDETQEQQEEDNKKDDEKEPPEEVKNEEKPLSRPKQTDAAEKDKNGVRRKKLYIAFIEWCKEYNNKNTFGSIFDKDAFNVSYPFVPHEMRYFYRLANPMLCVLSGNLTFFPVAELKKLNSENKHLDEMLIFAATENDVRVFSNKDKKVYFGIEENGEIKLTKVLSDTFDTYIQTMIDKGDILNGPIESESNKSEN